MIGLIKDTLQQTQCKGGFILDGFPRTLAQAEAFDKLCREMKHPTIYFVTIDVDESEIIERLTNRRACKVCHNIFNYNDIKGLKVCPNCGAKDSFYQRNDDSEEVIRNRLKIYYGSTKPVLSFFEKQDKVIYIDGSRPVNEVTVNILHELEKRTGEKIKISV